MEQARAGQRFGVEYAIAGIALVLMLAMTILSLRMGDARRATAGADRAGDAVQQTATVFTQD